MLAADAHGILLTNEKRVVNYCTRQNLVCLNLSQLLRLLWQTGTLSPVEVQTLMRNMTEAEGILFKNPERIFVP